MLSSNQRLKSGLPCRVGVCCSQVLLVLPPLESRGSCQVVASMVTDSHAGMLSVPGCLCSVKLVCCIARPQVLLSGPDESGKGITHALLWFGYHLAAFLAVHIQLQNCWTVT
jgi:hypothetical protein